MKTKIACVGDSITYGFLLFPRKKHAYPTIVQQQLGAAFCVRNFGVNGATVTQTGNRPYMKQQQYRESISFAPDIVIVMLSTNDTRVMNRDTARFMRDYEELLASYEKLSAKIIVMTSPQIYCARRRHTPYYGMDATMLAKYRSMIQEICERKRITCLDMYTISLAYPQCFAVDGVHPNKLFAAVMGAKVAAKILAHEKD